MYKTRAHGYLLKAPIRRENVLELIHQLWIERFPVSTKGCIEEIEDFSKVSVGEGPHDPIRRVKSSDQIKSVSQHQRREGDFGIDRPATTTGADLMQSVDTIDELLVQYAKSETNWPAIRDKYQVLKGDMMTLLHRVVFYGDHSQSANHLADLMNLRIVEEG